jgi:hypothetical protein
MVDRFSRIWFLGDTYYLQFYIYVHYIQILCRSSLGTADHALIHVADVNSSCLVT